jgi:hypothetical protein
MRTDTLISAAYLETQRTLHAAPRGYGARGAKWAETVTRLAQQIGATSILDYGCGQGSLGRTLRAVKPATWRIDEYDPAIAGKNHPPSFADLVVCTDVLEHIEPDRLMAVLAHLRLLARKAVLLVINLREANKTLSDGRNAHLIIETPEWWEARLREAGFTLVSWPADVPLAQSLQANPEKRKKCWIVVVQP